MSGFVIRYNKTTLERIMQESRGVNGHRDALQERMRLEREEGLGPGEVVSLNARLPGDDQIDAFALFPR